MTTETHPYSESVADYPRPPRLEPVPYLLAIDFGGVRIAETASGYRVLETFHPPTYYLPQDAFIKGALVAVLNKSSICEFKGRARYWDIISGSARAPAAGWSYPDPRPGYKAITDCIAVYAEPMDACFVGAARAIPQPGNFYGGWVTPGITGPIKGAPGTTHW